MAYVPKTWTDRQVEHPNRREITHPDTTVEQVSVARDEGTIYEEGDAFTAANMNNLESRIAAGIRSAVTTDTYPAIDTTEKTIVGSLNELAADKNIAPLYDLASTYDVGDYVVYETVLYKCTTAVTTAGAFDPSDWQACVVTDEMGSGTGAVIDDTTTAQDKTWSSFKINSELQDKQGVLTAGTGISISPQNVISATGGGSAELIKTATGSVVSFDDGADDLPVVDLTAQIVPKQSGSGDPSPSNVRPISGWTGANVTRTGVNIFDGTVTANTWFSNVDGTTEAQSGYSVTDFIKIEEGKSYYKGSNGSGRILFFDKDKNSITSAWNVMSSSATAFTAPTGAVYIRLTIVTSSVSAFFINTDSTDTAYHAYNGTTYSVTWQTEAGTVYGGTWKPLEGKMEIRTKRVRIGDYSWTYQEAQGRFYTAEMAPEIYKPVATDIPDDFYCEVFKPLDVNHALQVNNAIGIGTTGNVFIKTSAYSTETDLLNAVGNNYICIPLATPQTYQLTPTEVKTLLGVNNIFADTGDVSVTYRTKTASDIVDLVIDDSKVSSNTTWSSGRIDVTKADKIAPVFSSAVTLGGRGVGNVGANSYAQGAGAVASGLNSFARGTNTVASGSGANAEGNGSVASGANSRSTGRMTIASSENQFVFGRWNVEDDQDTYAEIVGNGDELQETRSNARTLDWSGNEYLAGNLTLGGNVVGYIRMSEVTGTLTAGQTSITLTDSAITATSTIEVFTDVDGVYATSKTVATGSVTLTFEAQQADLGVKVRVS